MTYETLITLQDKVKQVALYGTLNVKAKTEIVGCELGEMADGSRRHFALLSFSGLDTQLRVVTPAPEDRPEWARIYSDWLFCREEA